MEMRWRDRVQVVMARTDRPRRENIINFVGRLGAGGDRNGSIR